MSDLQLIELRIDEEFKRLIPPLTHEEYALLEQSIIADGCRESLCVWRNTIIDGHNRYEICHRHNIPFRILKISLRTREDAVSWICNNQLGRRNITEESRKYLIGRRYEAEKTVAARNQAGYNQHRRPIPPLQIPDKPVRSTAQRLGREYNISHATVDKYGIYARALDTLQSKDAEMVKKILSGQIKISHDNIVELSRLPLSEIRKISTQLAGPRSNQVGYSGSRRELTNRLPPKREAERLISAEIKNMPLPDPDAEVSSLSLTIPSWVSSIDRARTHSDFHTVSNEAKQKLVQQLFSLKECINTMLLAIKEDV